MRWEQLVPGGDSLTAHEASSRVIDPFRVDGLRVVAVERIGPDRWRWWVEDAVRDHGGERGPQPRVQRRGPITDFIYRDGGLARCKCVHGITWPEGDWCTGYGPLIGPGPHGRACFECVSQHSCGAGHDA